MKIKCISISLLLSLSLMSKFAYAALEIVITQGRSGAMPIAVMPFDGQSANDQQIADVIAKNLQNSGYFNLTQGNDAQRSSENIDLEYWQKQGANNIVIGEVENTSNNRRIVTVKLLDPVNSDTVILNKQYTVNAHDLRRLSHYISDEIFQALTGEKGIFSTRIAYIMSQNKSQKGKENYTLEVADADGQNPKSLLRSSSPIMSPSWSPDGKKIAYVSFENNTAEIYSVDVASGRRELITSYPGINGAPSWSPDGKKLAVVLSKSGHPNIYVIDLATKQLERLTTTRAIDTEPSWSLDGKAIIFTSDRSRNPQIYRINLADKKTERITFDGNYNASATYSPTGKDIILLHRSGSGFNIALQDINSGYISPLTRFGNAESPSIAPNGRMVLYATKHGGRGVLSIVSTDGRVRLRLPSRTGDVQEPAWSPFLE